MEIVDIWKGYEYIRDDTTLNGHEKNRCRKNAKILDLYDKKGRFPKSNDDELIKLYGENIGGYYHDLKSSIKSETDPRLKPFKECEPVYNNLLSIFVSRKTRSKFANNSASWKLARVAEYIDDHLKIPSKNDTMPVDGNIFKVGSFYHKFCRDLKADISENDPIFNSIKNNDLLMYDIFLRIKNRGTRKKTNTNSILNFRLKAGDLLKYIRDNKRLKPPCKYKYTPDHPHRKPYDLGNWVSRKTFKKGAKKMLNESMLNEFMKLGWIFD